MAGPLLLSLIITAIIVINGNKTIAAGTEIRISNPRFTIYIRFMEKSLFGNGRIVNVMAIDLDTRGCIR